MSLLILDEVSLALGGKSIFEELGLRIADKDRIGLIGPNGAGKSTLLKLFTGQQQPDGGQVHRRKELRLGYLPQEIEVLSTAPLVEFVLETVPGRKELEGAIEAVQTQLEGAAKQDPSSDEVVSLSQEISDLHDRLSRFEDEYSEHAAKQILSGLGFQQSDHERGLGEFSGGWQMRAYLASLLFQRPDLLLLDEPTNHLDMPSVAWLSGFLKRYDRAFVLISHDREFLNEQIERVVSFEVEGVRSYRGDYERYLKQRAEEETILEARARNLNREREQMERFVKRFRAQASKARLVQSRVKALEKMDEVQTLGSRRKISFRFPPCERTGRDVITGENIDKHYDELRVLKDVDVRLERGDRVAIVGANGAGKTTLLRILAGELEASSGEVKLGHKVKLGYYAQHHVDVLSPTATAFEEVQSAAAAGGRKEIFSALGAMLFSEDDTEKRIGVLSGGERARVALARLLVDPGNVLLMDEPTNHLDLESSERLAEAMADYEGTLLFVSHNRGFVRRLAKTIWHVEDGHVEVYPGNLDEYISSMRDKRSGTEATSPTEVISADQSPSQSTPAKPRRETRAEAKERKRREAEERNVLRPLRREVEKLERAIAELEGAQQERTELLGDPAIYSDAAKRDELIQAHELGAKDLEYRTAEWMIAQEKLDEAESKVRSISPDAGDLS